MTTYENLTLERGDGPGSEGLIAWRQEVHNPNGPEAAEDSMRREVIIELLDKQGAPARRWNVTAAWPSELDTSDLQATADEPVIRKLTLANEGVHEENIG
jgi:phage tail-like protein